MKYYFLLASVTLLLAGCAPTQPTLADCTSLCEEAVMCEEPEPIEPKCDFETSGAIEYFTLEQVQVRVDDTDCDEGFVQRQEETTYDCKIKRAEPLRTVGRDAEGKNRYEWRIDCACRYS